MMCPQLSLHRSVVGSSSRESYVAFGSFISPRTRTEPVLTFEGSLYEKLSMPRRSLNSTPPGRDHSRSGSRFKCGSHGRPARGVSARTSPSFASASTVAVYRAPWVFSMVDAAVLHFRRGGILHSRVARHGPSRPSRWSVSDPSQLPLLQLLNSASSRARFNRVSFRSGRHLEAHGPHRFSSPSSHYPSCYEAGSRRPCRLTL